MNYFLIFILFSVVLCASAKKYEDETNFHPSTNRYFEYNLSSSYNKSKPEAKNYEKGRFGLPIVQYGSTGSGSPYPNTGGVSYMVNPMKIDIGGVALGALLGLGVVLILPKLAHALGGHGYRSLDDGVSSVTDMLSKLDNTLEQHNIDSSSCMQRFVCNYVYEAQKNIQSGDANTLDEMIYAISNNSMVTQLLNGSSIKQAVDMGKSGGGEQCSSLYKQCPISRENVIKIMTGLFL